MDNSKLELGWCQVYMGLQYHMEEALIEKNLQHINATSAPPLALFSKKYYNDINKLNHDKKYDYCFIGSINSNYNARKWVIEFAKKNFTNNSIFVNTDNNHDYHDLTINQNHYIKLLSQFYDNSDRFQQHFFHVPFPLNPKD